MSSSVQIKKKIPWDITSNDELLHWNNVNTVCEESRCPNRVECSKSNTATFLIGGKHCTRSCRFCHVESGHTIPIKEIRDRELNDIIEYARNTDYKYLVITSVTRDDEPIELALHFSNITLQLKKLKVRVELLIPDFNGDQECLHVIGKSNPDVLAHNVETVRRLTKLVRNKASYKKSLTLFDFFSRKYPRVVLKSGIMVGLGELKKEIETTCIDIANKNVDLLTVGQYLQPSMRQIPVQKIYSEYEFEQIEHIAEQAGFKAIQSGPFVRSSYKAREMWEKVNFHATKN